MRIAIAALLLAEAVWSQQPGLWLDLSGPWRIQLGDEPEQTLRLPLGRNDWFGPRRGADRKAWLRKRVTLPAWVDRGQMSLTLGAIEDVYEVYINGQRIGATGSFDSFEDAQTGRARTFDIPATAVGSQSDLEIAIRIRRALTRPAWIRIPDEGPYLLTSQAAAPREAAQHDAASLLLRDSPRLILHVLVLCIAGLAFLGWRMDPARRELLWFGFVCADASFNVFYAAWMLFGDARPFSRDGIPSIELLTSVLRWPLLAEFAIAALGIRSNWIRAGVWLGWSPWVANLIFGVRPMFLSPSALNVPTTIGLLVIGVEWWRSRSRLNFEGHLLRFALAVPFLQRTLTIGTRWRSVYAGSLRVDMEDVAMLLITLMTLALLFRRMAADRREKLRLADEMEAARTVQQLLMPSSEVIGAGFAGTAIYHSAQEVGGDFHWNRLAPDGSLVVVIGDVSGKGLKAAMLVSMAVGVLRNENASEPALVLSALNTALNGHTGGGFVTACCVRFEPGGRVTVANAGHLTPWLDAEEVPAEPGLPLGVIAEVEYTSMVVVMPPGAGMTLVSDGVVEAASSGGELFGFDRTRAISTRSAREIAEAARAWGQNDDITVVTVRRSG